MASFVGRVGDCYIPEAVCYGFIMKSNYIVCYDIANEKRLRQVFKILSGIGTHMQYSVFFCRLTWQELTNLKKDLRDVIDEREDDIRIYPLPTRIKCTVIGRGDRVPEGVEVFI